jgi:hypothetical protein
MIPPGTDIQVRTDNPITVSRWDRGRVYPAYVDHDVFNRDGDLAIPRGANCELMVRQVGPDQLALDLESVTVNGRRYVMDTSGPQFNMNRDQYNNGAGLVGNIIGAIAGAAGADVEYRGDRVRVPAGADLTFQLREPLHVVNWGDPGYMHEGYHYHHEHDWYR